ncbi:MAG TPA: YARHG domain-containing protein [Mucilaginibacter sp.]|nr:YARHG domain-containing protein [Mucilaginibacter sp.]
MKTKPVIITIGILVLLTCGYFIFRSKAAKAGNAEITEFLTAFSKQAKAGNADSLYSFFETNTPPKALKRLVNLLTGKEDINGGLTSVATIDLDAEASKITMLSSGLITAKIPVNISQHNFGNKASVLTLKIHKTASQQFKIVQVEAKKFLNDYMVYEGHIMENFPQQKIEYSAITLAAFKNAAVLKKTYDSVLYFEHVSGKTFYYVARGKFASYDGSTQDTDAYKMGLVSPELKEIIPVDYDLIHNIDGTLDGLVEVEKGGKKGLFNLDGKAIVPPNYEQVLPLKDDSVNLALLRKGNDYYYLKKDMTLTDKVDGLKIGDVLPKIKYLDENYTLSEKSSANIMEYNSKENYSSLIIPPSYLVELEMLPKYVNLKDTLRRVSYNGKEVDMSDGTIKLDINYDGGKQDGNWFQSIYYSVVDNFVDGRSGLYEKNRTRKLVLVDKTNNRLMGYNTDSYYNEGDDLDDDGEVTEIKPALCNENNLRAINDTLFEFKTSGSIRRVYFNKKAILSEGPDYHYLHVRNGKLLGLPNDRIFGCTKYVKMDDSYLTGCFVIRGKSAGHITPEILRYMKNEIYASYKYKFKGADWNEAFEYMFHRYDAKLNDAVDDSLTAIDKYNINWINQKLNPGKSKSNSLAAK